MAAVSRLAFWRGLRIRVEPRGTHTVLHLAGRFLERDDERFEKAVAARPERLLILDLSQVTYMDSSALGALAEAHAVLHRSGRRLVLVGVNGPAAELLRLTRLDQVLEHYDSIEQVTLRTAV